MSRFRSVRRARHLWKDHSGGSMIEFAIVAPAFFLLFIGFMEVGYAVYRHSTVSHAVSEAARYGAVRGAASNAPVTEAALQTWALDNALLTGSGATATASFLPDNIPGSTVQVVVNYTHTPVVGAMFGMFNVNMTATSEITITR